LYKPEDVVVCLCVHYVLTGINNYGQLSWHVPNDDEIGFAIQIFKDIVDPSISILESLIAPGKQDRLPFNPLLNSFDQASSETKCGAMTFAGMWTYT
jgi:hypothetical protein